MPAGHYDQDTTYTSQQSYSTPNHSYHANESAASILKTVKAQEAQFERLTKKLEAEREDLARQSEQYRAGSQTASMNSISTAGEDSYQWRSPQPLPVDDSYNWHSPQPLGDSRFTDESLGDSKMSSHLLDSCLRELEDRGTMNFGEDNMDYRHNDPYSQGRHEDPYSSQGRHEDPYSSQGRHEDPYSSQNRYEDPYSDHAQHDDPYGSHGRLPYNNEDSYNYSSGALNGGNPQYMDERSLHSSHISLQSTGSNRNNARMAPNGPNVQGSLSSLPRDQPHDNYMSYSSIPRQDQDSPPTPTRLNSYQQPPYSSQQDPDMSPRYSVASNDSFTRQQFDAYNRYDPRDIGPPMGRGSYDAPPSDQGVPPYGSHSHINNDPRYGDSDPRYGDVSPYNHQPINRDPYGDPNYEPQNDSRVNDSFYRDSPDGYKGGPMMDPPSRSDSYRHPDEGYGGPPHLDDRYGAPDDRYRDNSYDDDPRIRGDNSGMPESDISGQYRPPEDQFRDMSLDDPSRDQLPPGDRYGEPPPMDERYREGPPNDSYDREPHQTYGDYDDHPYRSIQKHEGLPTVQSDPFADDPFQKKAALGEDDRYRGPPHEDPYSRNTPSPGAGSDRYGGQYNDQPPRYNESPQPPAYYQDDMGRSQAVNLNAPPPDDYHSDTQSTDGGNWRNPDLQEVIDYLSHPSEAVKANAAGYLQHLCYNNDDLKSKTRGLDGIPPLVELLQSDYPEVQRNACGALKNLSYGKNRTGLDNKKAIEHAGGVTSLIRLLRKVQDEEIKDMITGILWNLSSCEDLKGKIISEGLTDLVNRVIVPYSRWDQRQLSYTPNEPWTTVFRNATGIIRNLSSAGKEDEQRGYEVRNKLRECSKLVNCLVYALKLSIENHDRDSKPVENCTCALRNLSFRIQEVSERDFYRKRTMTLKKRQQPDKASTGCLGGGGKKKSQQSKTGKPDLNQNAELRLPPGAQEYKALWENDVVRYYLSILKDGSNPVTVEAAAGAVQNLTACYWPASDSTRALVRKEKGLPDLVDLLTQERDSIVCHVALALRNLAIDERNKELIGKYAMKQLISRLPQERQNEGIPDRTISAVIATLLEITKNNIDFVLAVAQEGAIPRLTFIKLCKGKYLQKTKEHANALLTALWDNKSLQQDLTKYGLQERLVKEPVAMGRADDSGSPGDFSTMSRLPGSQGYDDHTLSPGRPMEKSYPNSYGHSPMNGRMDNYQSNMVHGHSNPAMHDQGRYYDGRRGDEIPMTDMAPGYAPLDDQRQRKAPVGGVPLFPGLQPQANQVSHQAEPQQSPNEQLYAQVDKSKKRNPGQMGPPSPNHNIMDLSGGPREPGGADSWV